MAAWPAKPAASDVVAHATLKGRRRPCQRHEYAAVTARVSTRVLTATLMDFRSVFSRWFPDSDVNG